MTYSLIPTTLNELINLIILNSAQLSTQSLKDAKLSLHISYKNLDSSPRRDNSGEVVYCRLSWNKLNSVDGIMDTFANVTTIRNQWLEYYKKCDIPREPCFVFISSYTPNSETIRKLILSDKGVKMVESHDKTDINENSFEIIIPPFISDSDYNSTKIFESLKNILHSHSIINPKLTTSIELTHNESLIDEWTHERRICPFNYYQLGKYFTNDMNTFNKSHVPNVNAYITPPNYRRLAKPQTICVESCTACRWKIFFLACVLPPLKPGSKLSGDDLSGVSVLLMGPHNTLLFTPESAPVLSPRSWARWGKFLVKLSNSNSNSQIINTLSYVNNLDGKTAENSLIILIGFDLDPPEQDFSKKADSLHFLTSNFTEIIEANENFIQSSCETLLSKLVQNLSSVKTKQDDSFLLGELCNAINSIIHRSTNPEVKADYLNELGTNSLDQTHDILHQKLVSIFEEHLQQFEPSITANDKRGNKFTPTQPKKQITDQAFEDLEHYNEEEDYNYLQELPLMHDGAQEFSYSANFGHKTSQSRNKSESSSLLKSPLFDLSSLPPTPRRPEKHSQSSGDAEFNDLADEFSSPLAIPRVDTPKVDQSSIKHTEISPFNVPKTPSLSFVNSQNSARTDSSQDFKLLSNEELLFSPSLTYSHTPGQCGDSPRAPLSSQADYDELAREL